MWGSWSHRAEISCRTRRISSISTRSYEDVGPLYQFGHTAGQNPEYQGHQGRSFPEYLGRSFEAIEPEIQRGWGEEQSTRFGNWHQARDYVSYGYTQCATGGTTSL